MRDHRRGVMPKLELRPPLGLRLPLVVVAIVLATSLFATHGAAGRSQTAADPYREAIAEGEAALQRRQFLTALEAFKRANLLRQNTSPEAYLGMSRASYGHAVFSESLRNADRALTHVTANPRLEAAVRHQRARALVSLAESPDDGRLAEAQREFTAAGVQDHAWARPSLERGEALLAAYRDAEGLQELRRFVAGGDEASNLESARQLIASPRLARQRFAAPAFAFTTSAGETFSPTTLRGKVVLLDFWGSWCPPCRENTPGLVELHRKYGDRIVMIGVAVHEETPQIWRDYVAEHGKSWPQYLESDRTAGAPTPMSAAFQVPGVPIYIVIDREGIVRARLMAWGDEGPVELEKAIVRALAVPAAHVQP